jgi:hypothetical protein
MIRQPTNIREHENLAAERVFLPNIEYCKTPQKKANRIDKDIIGDMTKAKPKSNKGNKKAEDNCKAPPSDSRKAPPPSPSKNKYEEANAEGKAKMPEGTGSPPLNRALRNRIISEQLDDETARILEIERVSVFNRVSRQFMELAATNKLHRW